MMVSDNPSEWSQGQDFRSVEDLDMATATLVPAEQRNVLWGVDWQTYLHLRNLPENDGLRMTYDRGRLEIMSPSPRHEGFAHILGRLIDTWTEELNIPILGLRTMTCKREDIERGFEPDNCYYVQNEPRMWDKTDVDFLVDPPPDLALEIEITRGLVGKMAIYESFGVPELWQFDGRKLQVYELADDGHYRARQSSLCFPTLPMAEVEQTVRQAGKVHETDLVRGFREWVRRTFTRETG